MVFKNDISAVLPSACRATRPVGGDTADHQARLGQQATTLGPERHGWGGRCGRGHGRGTKQFFRLLSAGSSSIDILASDDEGEDHEALMHGLSTCGSRSLDILSSDAEEEDHQAGSPSQRSLPIAQTSAPQSSRTASLAQLESMGSATADEIGSGISHAAPDAATRGHLSDDHIVFDGVSPPQLQDLYSEVKQHFGETKARRVTVRDVVTHIIIPRCGARVSYARYINQRELKRANIFITHSWDELFYTLVVAVLSATHHKRAPVVWICALALVQGSSDIVGQQLEGSICNLPFALALKECDHYLVVRNDQVDVFSRGWCVFELAVAKLLKMHDIMDIAGPDTFKEQRGKWFDARTSLEADWYKILKFLSNMNSKFQDELNELMNDVRARKDRDLDDRESKAAELADFLAAVAASPSAAAAIAGAVPVDPASAHDLPPEKKQKVSSSPVEPPVVRHIRSGWGNRFLGKPTIRIINNTSTARTVEVDIELPWDTSSCILAPHESRSFGRSKCTRVTVVDFGEFHCMPRATYMIDDGKGFVKVKKG